MTGFQAQSQAVQAKLNLVELLKQFIGLWRSNFAKDTTEFWEANPYRNGLEAYCKDGAKGKITLEGKQFWGYDAKLSKFIYYYKTLFIMQIINRFHKVPLPGRIGAAALRGCP